MRVLMKSFFLPLRLLRRLSRTLRKKPDCFWCGGLWLGRVRVPADADRRFLLGCRRRRPAGA